VPKYSFIYRLTPRYRHFFKFERAVFGEPFNTHILSLSDREKAVYQQYYGTPEDRFHLMPPTLDKSQIPERRSEIIRNQARKDLGIKELQKLVLFIGSGYKTKGLDRAIQAIASLALPLRGETKLLIVGQDNKKPYVNLIKRLEVDNQIRFLGGRSDIPELLAAGDILLHPAYRENTGTVLLEAISSGLPVVTTDVCGYATHVKDANAGIVLESPFQQKELNKQLAKVLTSKIWHEWSDNGLAYGKNPMLYSMPEHAVDTLEQCSLAEQKLTPIDQSPSRCFYIRDDLRASIDSDKEFDYIMDLQGELFRQGPGRRTLKFERGGRSYFLKVHTGVGWQEILKNLLYFRLPVLGATNEWHGIHLLNRLGIDTLNIAAYAAIGKNPAHKQSFVVTDELSPSISLEDYCKAWATNPPVTPDEIRFKRWLIKKLAEIARTIHASGANHRDFYLCHFLLNFEDQSVTPNPNSCKIHVIDLHRMQIRSKTPRRWLVKDISGLFYSSMDIGLTKRDLLRFMQVYQEKPLREILNNDQLFWRQIGSKAMSQYISEQRKTKRRLAQQGRTAIAG